MKLVLTISLDNAAFTDKHQGAEVARILRKYAVMYEPISRFEVNHHALLKDVNGNTVEDAQVYCD